VGKVLPTEFMEGKGIIHTITGREGTEGEYRYGSALSLTSALDGSGWSTQRSGHFTPGRDPVHIVQESGRAPRPVSSACMHI
jgi:hypothetical protein